jgi:hypothetical protein
VYYGFLLGGFIISGVRKRINGIIIGFGQRGERTS